MQRCKIHSAKSDDNREECAPLTHEVIYKYFSIDLVKERI